MMINKILKGIFILILIVMSASPHSANAAVITDIGGDISHWTLDESSGTRVDSNANGNDLTDNNTVLAATGQRNNGADFEASNSEYLSIADASQTGLDFTGDFSISMWIKAETINTGQSLLSKYDATNDRSYLVRIQSDNTVRLSYFDSSDNETRVVTDAAQITSTSSWYHIVLTSDVSTADATIYIDGSSVASTASLTGATSVRDIDNTFSIGARGDPNQYFDGIIDEVTIWGKELTSGNVTTIYNSGTPLEYTGGATVDYGTIIWFNE